MVRRETRRRGVRLEVTEPYPTDAGSQRVRLDSPSLLHLGARPGDVVEIQGISLTFGLAAKARLEQYSRGNVALPPLLRENASVRVGDMITVEPASLEAATAVRLGTSAQPGLLPFDDAARRAEFRERLRGRPVCLGDRVTVAPDDADEAVAFRVAAVEPDDSAVLGPGTRYEIEGPSGERSRRPAEADLD